MRNLVIYLALATAVLAPEASPAAATQLPPSLQDSFRLGSGSGVLCRVQSAISGPAIKGMFDRAYTIVCRGCRRADRPPLCAAQRRGRRSARAAGDGA